MGHLLLAVVAVLCLRLAGSEDLYWRPNTDWNNANNWKLGRTPCKGDVADLSSVPRGSVVQLDGDVTVRSIVLSVGSTVILGRSLTLKLSNSTSCQIRTPSRPMVAPVEENNMFVGAGPKYWESSENWEERDGTPAKSPPCGKDRAFFREGHYYSSVESNQSKVYVQQLKVRGKLVTTVRILELAPEFKLNLTVNSRCGEDPSLCPCLTSPPSSGGRGGSDNLGQTAAIAVVVVAVGLVLVGVAVLLFVLWVRWRRTHYYKKDDPLGEPEDSLHSPTARAFAAGEGVLFDNPIYETGGGGGGGGKKGKGKKGKGSPDKQHTRAHEMESMAILRPSAGHYEPVDYAESTTSERKRRIPVVEEYEKL